MADTALDGAGAGAEDADADKENAVEPVFKDGENAEKVESAEKPEDADNKKRKRMSAYGEVRKRVV